MPISELEPCICPASRLQATQRCFSQHLNLLQILSGVADDGRRSLRGWLGFFSLTQCDSIERIGLVPWNTVASQPALGPDYRSGRFLMDRYVHLSLRISHLAPPV